MFLPGAAQNLGMMRNQYGLMLAIQSSRKDKTHGCNSGSPT